MNPSCPPSPTVPRVPTLPEFCTWGTWGIRGYDRVHQAVLFLSVSQPRRERAIELRAFASHAARSVVRRWYPHDPPGRAGSPLRSLSDQHDVYVGVQPRSRRGGDTSAVSRIGCLYATGTRSDKALSDPAGGLGAVAIARDSWAFNRQCSSLRAAGSTRTGCSGEMDRATRGPDVMRPSARLTST